jgi:hypothetical protein
VISLDAAYSRVALESAATFPRMNQFASPAEKLVKAFLITPRRVQVL